MNQKLNYIEHLSFKYDELYENLYERMELIKMNQKLNYIEHLSSKYDELYKSLYEKMGLNIE